MRIKQHYTRDTIPERDVSKPYYPPKRTHQERQSEKQMKCK